MKVEFRPGTESEASFCSQQLCPLNRVKAGIAVRVKQLCASPALTDRLREIGFCEESVIKLLTSQNNIICMVCNTRFALSPQIAQSILVEPVTEPMVA